MQASIADGSETCKAGLDTAKRIGDLGFQSRLYASLAVAYCALTNQCDIEVLRAQRTTKTDGCAEDRIMKKDWTIQDCKDHMTMSKKDGTKKDGTMMKMDSQCADKMKGGKMKKVD